LVRRYEPAVISWIRRQAKMVDRDYRRPNGGAVELNKHEHHPTGGGAIELNQQLQNPIDGSAIGPKKQ